MTQTPSASLPKSGFLFVLLTSLYFSQGFPSGLLAHALPAIMRDYGSSIAEISMLKLLALPWLFKFLWAPLLDKYFYAPLGPHRSWIFVMQGGAVITLCTLALLSPEWLFNEGILYLFIFLLLLNLFSSTQDVATDGLAVTLLSEKLRGIGNSIQVCGYKVGLMLGGGGLLILMESLGWQTTVGLVAIILVVMLLPSALFNENKALKAHRNQTDDNSHSNKSVKSEENLLHAKVEKGYNFWSFFQSKGVITWLFVLISYKWADSVSSVLVKPMLIDIGYSKAAVGEITLISSLAGLGAAVAVGLVYTRILPIILLVSLGVLQIISIGAYSVIPGLDLLDESAQTVIYGIVIADQMVDSMSTVVLFALMMQQCRKGHEGGDYTLQACIQVLAAGIIGFCGGLVADALDNYSLSFYLSASLGVLSLLAIYFYSNAQKILSRQVATA